MSIATENTREAWLAERMTMIGASESPAILGEGYADENAWTIWAKKLGILKNDETEEAEFLEWGREMQPVVIKMFTKRTGIEVEDLGEFTILRHPEYEWLGSTLDGLARNTPDGKAVVETKNIGQYNAREWAEGTPLRVQIQIQQQIACAEADVGYAAACIGGRKLVWAKEYRNDRFIKAMIRQLKEFWQCVLDKTPPDRIDGSAATKKVIALLHPNDTGGEVSLPEEAVHWWRRVERCRALARAAEKLKGEAENKLAMAFGDATFGLLPSGEVLSYKTQDRAGFTVEPTSFRVLRKVNPKKK